MSLRKGEQKGLMMGGIIVAVVILGGLWAAGVIDLTPEEPLTYYAPVPTVAPGVPIVQPTERICQGLAQTPTIKMKQVDRHNPGTAISGGQNMYRLVGEGSWTDVGVGSTFTETGYSLVEVVSGIDSDGQATTEFGPYYPSWEVPCRDKQDLVLECGNDATYDELTGTYYDRYGTAATTEKISVADTPTLAFSFQGKYEKDYGNIYCGGVPYEADDTNNNALIIQYNTTSVDEVTLTSIVCTDTGVSYPVVAYDRPTTGAVSTLLTDVGEGNASNKGFVMYKFPVLETSRTYKGTYYLKVDGTYEVSTNEVNMTLWDVDWYRDDDTGLIVYGIEDEDSTNIGAADFDVISVVFE